MPNVPIDWLSVNWLYVILLALLVFLCAWIGNAISFKRGLLGAVISTVLFLAGFIFWTYYPHGLPLPASAVIQKTAAPAPSPPPTPPPPAMPDNPVKDVAPPSTKSQ